MKDKGNILYGMGKFNESIELYDRAISLNLSDEGAWYRKSLALQSLGRDSDSGEAYNKAKSLGLNDSDVMIIKGTMLYLSGKYNDSLKAFDEATKLDPDSGDAWFNKICVLRALHRDSEADEALSRTLGLIFS